MSASRTLWKERLYIKHTSSNRDARVFGNAWVRTKQAFVSALPFSSSEYCETCFRFLKARVLLGVDIFYGELAQSLECPGIEVLPQCFRLPARTMFKGTVM
jgi:hypothetical protein